MIRSSFAFFLFLLIVWTIIVNKTDYSFSQNLLHRNLIKAEKYIFEETKSDNVILGSSLAARLVMDSLPNFYNLSFEGKGIFDGLNILRNKEQFPKAVYIETNILIRKENTVFKEIISSEGFNQYLYPFRGMQPLTIGGAIISKYTQLLLSSLKHKNELRSVEATENNTLFEKMLDAQINSYTNFSDDELLNEQIELLEEHVDFLQKKQVEVIFFEMPVNYQLINLHRAVLIREKMKTSFSPLKYDYIRLPDNITDYKTTDGAHLSVDESRFYTSYFKKELKKNINSEVVD